MQRATSFVGVGAALDLAAEATREVCLLYTLRWEMKRPPH